jgi:hypothetical protein
MHEQCERCNATNPEIIIATKTRPEKHDRKILCLGCALEDSDILKYLATIALRNASENEKETTP